MKINPETLLNSILENNHSVIFAVDKEYKYLFFNGKHKEIMKATYGVEIVIGINALDCLLVEQDRKQAKEALDKVFMGESFIATQEFGDDASLKSTYELYYYPLKKEGEIYGATLFITDVSERILLEKRKILYENRQLAFAQMIPDFLVVSSSDGVRKYANKSYCDFFETTADQIIGINYFDFIPEKERDYYFEMLQNITPQAPSFSIIHLLTNSSGKSQWTLWHETGVFDNQSSLIECVAKLCRSVCMLASFLMDVFCSASLMIY